MDTIRLALGFALMNASTFIHVFPAHAEDAKDFYTQRTIRLLVPYAPGGTYDLYARLVSDHFGNYVPGHPTMVVQHMPGAGGLVATHALYAREAQDGTVFSILPRDIAANQMLRPESAKYDARKFGWIGGVATFAGVLFVFKRTGVETVADLKTKSFVVGSWGQATESFTTPTLLNALIGTKVKIVTGYSGGPDVDLAAERGEVDGRVASWSLLKGQRSHWLEAGLISIPFQTGPKRHPELPNVPLMTELATDVESRQILELVNADAGIGYSLVTTPNVDPSRLSALRAAFNQMVRDPAFASDAKKRELEVVASTSEELEQVVAKTLSTPQSALAKLKTIIGAAN